MSGPSRRIKIREMSGREGPPPEVYVKVAIGDGWTVHYRLQDEGGVLVVAEVQLFHGEGRKSFSDDMWSGSESTPHGGLTAARLRSVPLAIIRPVLEKWEESFERQEWLTGQGSSWSRRVLGAFGSKELRSAPRRPGRHGRGDRFYAELARGYVKAYQRDPRRPVALLGEKLGKPWTPEKVRDALHDARRRGMLTTLGAGRAGGALTERALKVLGDSKPRRTRAQLSRAKARRRDRGER